MLARDVARMLGESVSSENFAANRTDELSVTSVAAEFQETEKPALWFFRRNYCRCHVMLPCFSCIQLRHDECARRMRIQLSVAIGQPSLGRG